MKLTPQRLAILKYLEANREHPSAADIFRAVSKEYPTMSLSTVYNTLKDIEADKRTSQSFQLIPIREGLIPTQETTITLFACDAERLWTCRASLP